MTTEVINIQIREDGSRVVARNIGGIGDAADRAAGPVEALKGLLLTVVSGATVVTLARYADQYTNIQNRLRLVTDGTANLARVTRELQSVANDTRSDFVSTAELYARLASSTKDLGLGQQDLLTFTRSVNQAIVLSGASAEEAAGGIRQLAQGLASGTLRGDELNSVLENFPRAADVIAESVGVTRGELRKLGAEGQITADMIVTAFLEAGDELNSEFATTIPTLSQSFTVLRNQLLLYVGELNEKYKITETISKLVMTLSQNLDTLVPILGAVAAAIAAAFLPGLITAFAARLQTLWALLAANPFLALAAVIAGAVAAIVLFRDEIKLGIDDTTTLGDLLRSIWESIGPVIEGVASLIGDFFSWISGKSADAYNNMIGHTDEYSSANEAGWLSLLRTVAQVFDMIGGVIRGTMMGVWNLISTTVRESIKAFEALGAVGEAALSFDLDGARAAMDNYANVWATGAENIASSFGSAFSEEQLAQADSGLEAWLNERLARAQEISRERLAGLGEEGGLTPGAGGGAGGAGEASEEAAKALERLANALRGVLDEANPVAAAQRRLAEVQGVLNESVAAGLLLQQEADEAYASISENMRAQLDPLGALNAEIERNIEFLQMGNQEREIEMALYQSLADLQRAGVRLTQEETDALRAKLVVEQELTRIAQMRDSLESGSQGQRQRDVQDLMAAIAQAQGDPSSGLSSGDAFNALNNAVGGNLGNSRAATEAQLEEQAFYFEQVQAMRDMDLINEETYQAARIQIWANTQSIQLQSASDFFGSLTVLAKSQNQKLANIGKTAAIAQTIINTYQSATSAYAAMAGIPYVGPFLGAAAAAAAVVAGMANVSAIRSQSTAFRTGGNLTVGGNGGTDSQLVSFWATPGERVQVNTPAQARALENLEGERMSGRSNGPPTVNLTVVQQGKADRTTPYQTARAVRRETAKEYNRS